METQATAGQPVYKDFVPSYKLVQEEGIDTIVVELSEFTKEQIRVLLENFGNLRISGERPLADNRWSRFRNVFEVPKESNEIHTRFENGRLYVQILPKLTTEAIMEAAIKITGSEVKDQSKQVQNTNESQKTTTELKLSTDKDEKTGDKRKDAVEVDEKDGQSKEKFEIRELGLGFSKPMQILVNLIVAVVVLVVMTWYMTPKN